MELSSIVHDQGEQVKYVLGQEYLQTILGGGGLSKGALILSDKKGLVSGVTVQTINNIMSRTIIMFCGLGIVALGAVMEDIPTVVAMIIGCMFFLVGMALKSKKYVFVDYAGGSIACDHSWFKESDIDSFRKLVFLEKDRLKSEKSEVRKAPVQHVAKKTYIDEIRELSQLRDEGIITDEQFEAKKSELMR